MVMLFLYLSKPTTSVSNNERDLYILMLIVFLAQLHGNLLSGRLGFIIPPCMRTHLNFSRVNEVEAMYGRSLVNVKVESRSIFT